MVQAIFAANPDIFTCQKDWSGDFISCMDSIQGGMYFINGNHDMTIGCDEINPHFQRESNCGKRVLGADDPWQNVTYRANGICAQHGHEYSLTCRPSVNNKRYDYLPLAYFVTRLVSLNCLHLVQQDNLENVSQLPEGGHPVFSIESYFQKEKSFEATLAIAREGNLAENFYSL